MHFARCSLRHEKTFFVPGSFLSRVTSSAGFRTNVEMSFAVASIKSELWDARFSVRTNERRFSFDFSFRRLCEWEFRLSLSSPISSSPRCIRPTSRPPPCADWSSGFTHFPLFIRTSSPFIKRNALICKTKKHRWKFSSSLTTRQCYVP